MSQSRQEVMGMVDDVFSKGPNWVTFFREILGVDGVLRRTFTDPTSLAAFQKSEEYEKIEQMLKKLREKGDGDDEQAKEPTRVITVRMPKSLHECLRAQAKDSHMSMNQLCISKLLQLLDGEPIGTEEFAFASTTSE